MRSPYRLFEQLAHILDPNLKQHSLIAWIQDQDDESVLLFLDLLFEYSLEGNQKAYETLSIFPLAFDHFDKSFHLKWYFTAKIQKIRGALFCLYPYVFKDDSIQRWNLTMMTPQSDRFDLLDHCDAPLDHSDPLFFEDPSQHLTPHSSSSSHSRFIATPPQLDLSDELNQALIDCLEPSISFSKQDSSIHSVPSSITQDQLQEEEEGGLTLGEKRTLAKSNRAQDFERLYTESDPMIAQNLMNRPRLKESDLIRLLALTPQNPLILGNAYVHPKWRHYLGVQETLLFNPYTPLKYRTSLALKLFKSLSAKQKRETFLPSPLLDLLDQS